MGEGSRGALEAWGDGIAACNNGESPHCLAYPLCRARFAVFDLGRALLTGSMKGWEEVVGRARRPDRGMWSPSAMHAQVHGHAAERWPLRPAPCQAELTQVRLWLIGGV